MKEDGRYFLIPAGIFVSKQPYLVSTVLGSCIAVCLWDPVLKIGGINHFMLPLWNGKGLASPKFGNIAIEKLVKRMLARGCEKLNLIAKIFGGGEIIKTNITLFHIGEKNIRLAQNMLKDYGIPIISYSVGGDYGRRIVFNTETGEVIQKYVGKHNV